MKPIYVVHPITPEQKAALRSKGKILDAKFAPVDAEILGADGKKYVPPKKEVK
jgi:hypothetical protein